MAFPEIRIPLAVFQWSKHAAYLGKRCLNRRVCPGIRTVLIVMPLVLHAGLLTWGALRQAPTPDEPAYLVAGIEHWRLGQFDLAKVSPPLVRLVAALPVLFAAPKTDWTMYQIGPSSRGEHRVGRRFLMANGRRSMWLFSIARWATIPFSVLGGLVCYCWAAQLYGVRSGLAAMVLWCFSPNILAHGQLMTPDVGVTALSVAAAYSFWQWSRAPSWAWSTAAGAVLGLAILAKTNALILVLILPAVSLLKRFDDSGRSAALRTAVIQQAAAIMIAIYVLNLGYGFQGSLERLERYQFVSRMLSGGEDQARQGNRFSGTLLGRIPVPVPKPFLEGIDLQRRDFENVGGQRETYFRGHWYDHGWWWYYFYVVAVKVPLGAWSLLLLGSLVAVMFRCRCRHAFDDLFVTVSGSSLFLLACSQTGFGHSLRYVLPAFPFAFIFASSAAAGCQFGRLRAIFCGVALTWHVVSSVFVYPHSLAYFNELAGGPRNGDAHLLDGNLDWGEGLNYLKEWIERHPEAKPLYVAYWNLFPADFLGFEFERPQVQAMSDGRSSKEELRPGWYAISVSHIRQDYRRRTPIYAKFLNYEPVATIGYTIHVYFLPPRQLQEDVKCFNRNGIVSGSR